MKGGYLESRVRYRYTVCSLCRYLGRCYSILTLFCLYRVQDHRHLLLCLQVKFHYDLSVIEHDIQKVMVYHFHSETIPFSTPFFFFFVCKKPKLFTQKETFTTLGNNTYFCDHVTTRNMRGKCPVCYYSNLVPKT